MSGGAATPVAGVGGTPATLRRASTPVTGLGALVRLAVRRSRWYLAVWLLGLFVVVPATARAYEQVIPDPAQAGPVIEGLANNPTMRAMLGPPFSLVEPGGFTVWRVGTFVVPSPR